MTDTTTIGSRRDLVNRFRAVIKEEPLIQANLMLDSLMDPRRPGDISDKERGSLLGSQIAGAIVALIVLNAERHATRDGNALDSYSTTAFRNGMNKVGEMIGKLEYEFLKDQHGLREAIDEVEGEACAIPGCPVHDADHKKEGSGVDTAVFTGDKAREILTALATGDNHAAARAIFEGLGMEPPTAAELAAAEATRRHRRRSKSEAHTGTGGNGG